MTDEKVRIINKGDSKMPVITSKELGTIQDQLNLERNLVNKYTEYAESTNDTVLKQKYEQIAAKHESHYETLFCYLTK